MHVVTVGRELTANLSMVHSNQSMCNRVVTGIETQEKLTEPQALQNLSKVLEPAKVDAHAALITYNLNKDNHDTETNALGDLSSEKAQKPIDKNAEDIASKLKIITSLIESATITKQNKEMKVGKLIKEKKRKMSAYLNISNKRTKRLIPKTLKVRGRVKGKSAFLECYLRRGGSEGLVHTHSWATYLI